ncbi:RNA-binding protein 39-like [Octopus sinensis]|uniref:RNA-binding protein 39-like n=1 Tax=Octopus sinensis TaxID=2607531 RepID=A0A6P7TVX5_9MOLL|nr:RNA-binding protein 39-like [Octopus sinensis]
MDDDFDVDAMLEDSYRMGGKQEEEIMYTDILLTHREPPPTKSRDKSPRKSDGSDKRSDRHRRRHRSRERRHSSKKSSRKKLVHIFENLDGLHLRNPLLRNEIVGQYFVRDVRLITDSKTRRSKGVAYVEFKSIEGADNAVKMAGQRLCGRPVVVQYSQAEKNRIASNLGVTTFTHFNVGPMKLYMSSIHPSVTEEMLDTVFCKYGRFANGEDGRRAFDQLNGYDLAGVKLRMSFVNETNDNRLDLDQSDRGGVELGAVGKLQLMNKLAEEAIALKTRLKPSSVYDNNSVRIGNIPKSF